jgi:hypothetical protein
MEQKPGRYWGVIGRQHLPVGEREVSQPVASRQLQQRIEPVEENKKCKK